MKKAARRVFGEPQCQQMFRQEHVNTLYAGFLTHVVTSRGTGTMTSVDEVHLLARLAYRAMCERDDDALDLLKLALKAANRHLSQFDDEPSNEEAA